MNLTPVRAILLLAAATLVAGLLFLGILRLNEKPEPEPLALPQAPRIPAPVAAQTPQPTPSQTPAPAPAPEPSEPEIAISGNGLSSLEIAVANRSGEPFSQTWVPGQTFDAGISQMVLADRATLDAPPAMRASATLRAYPMTAAGRPGPSDYRLSEPVDGDLRLLAETIAADPALGDDVARTAVLLLADNPPLDVFATFPRPPQPLAPDLNTESFRVATRTLVEAFALLRSAGLPWQNLQAVTDPQFAIEAMYDTDSHDAAARFFGIPREREWAFWKRLLLFGPPPLRHYALFGIARYFPDIAILMHPDWVAARHLPHLFRVTAVRSLAITDRSEAIPLLRRIRREQSGDPEMVSSADSAIAYLLWKTYRAAPPAERGTPPPLPGEEGPAL